jgi:hypothetical protein
MHAKGCKPDSIVYNAIIDALWETGLPWPQRHAGRLFRRASAAGLLRRGAHSAPDYTELCLHTLTPGIAVLSLYTWLADLRCGPPPHEPRKRTLLLTNVRYHITFRENDAAEGVGCISYL